MIRTPRLQLLPASAQALRASLVGADSLAAALGVQVPASWPPDLYDADAIRHSLDWMNRHPGLEQWGPHYIVHRVRDAEPGVLVGVGGFKGPSSADGEVEIGYAIVAEFQRRGFATEAVRAWVEMALATPEVSVVVAHTLASLAPSIGVLLKAGFEFVGEGHDPDAPAGEVVVRYAYPRSRDGA